MQVAAGEQWERPGPIFLRIPSMGTVFLVPTGVLAGLVAREATGRGQHVSTSQRLDTLPGLERGIFRGAVR